MNEISEWFKFDRPYLTKKSKPGKNANFVPKVAFEFNILGYGCTEQIIPDIFIGIKLLLIMNN